MIGLLVLSSLVSLAKTNGLFGKIERERLTTGEDAFTKLKFIEKPLPPQIDLEDYVTFNYPLADLSINPSYSGLEVMGRVNLESKFINENRTKFAYLATTGNVTIGLDSTEDVNSLYFFKNFDQFAGSFNTGDKLKSIGFATVPKSDYSLVVASSRMINNDYYLYWFDGTKLLAKNKINPSFDFKNPNISVVHLEDGGSLFKMFCHDQIAASYFSINVIIRTEDWRAEPFIAVDLLNHDENVPFVQVVAIPGFDQFYLIQTDDLERVFKVNTFEKVLGKLVGTSSIKYVENNEEEINTTSLLVRPSNDRSFYIVHSLNQTKQEFYEHVVYPKENFKTSTFTYNAAPGLVGRAVAGNSKHIILDRTFKNENYFFRTLYFFHRLVHASTGSSGFFWTISDYIQESKATPQTLGHAIVMPSCPHDDRFIYANKSSYHDAVPLSFYKIGSIKLKVISQHSVLNDTKLVFRSNPEKYSSRIEYSLNFSELIGSNKPSSAKNELSFSIVGIFVAICSVVVGVGIYCIKKRIDICKQRRLQSNSVNDINENNSHF